MARKTSLTRAETEWSCGGLQPENPNCPSQPGSTAAWRMVRRAARAAAAGPARSRRGRSLGASAVERSSASAGMWSAMASDEGIGSGHAGKRSEEDDWSGEATGGGGDGGGGRRVAHRLCVSRGKWLPNRRSVGYGIDVESRCRVKRGCRKLYK